MLPLLTGIFQSFYSQLLITSSQRLFTKISCCKVHQRKWNSILQEIIFLYKAYLWQLRLKFGAFLLDSGFGHSMVHKQFTHPSLAHTTRFSHNSPNTLLSTTYYFDSSNYECTVLHVIPVYTIFPTTRHKLKKMNLPNFGFLKWRNTLFNNVGEGSLPYKWIF